MEIPINVAEEIYKSVQSAQKIVIISHRNPDADTVGSNLALRLIFEHWGKQITSACVDQLPLRSNISSDFLPNIETYVREFNDNEFDLIFTVDAGSVAQTGFFEKDPEILKRAKIINIDHHPSNNHFGSINLVIDNAASTTLVIYHLLKIWKNVAVVTDITPSIATCLLYGLYYDTGSFMHSNTDESVYEMAADLLQKGAKRENIVKNLFKNHTVEQLQLWGKVLSEARLTEKNIVMGAVMNEDFSQHGANNQDLSGVIDYLSMANKNNYAALLSEDKEGNIRGSLRTRRDDVNLSEIAGSFGGGGHKKASGFILKGSLGKKTRWRIKPSDANIKN